MLIEQTPLEQLDELYRFLTEWASSQEKRLNLRQETLDERAKELENKEAALKLLEAVLTGNGND